MRFSASQIIALVAGVIVHHATPAFADKYDMVTEYAGQNFFDGWTFFSGTDDKLTNGDVNFLPLSTAGPAKLAYVDPNTNHAIMAVDNTSTVVSDNKRNSVRLQTNVRYGVGSVWIADMLHVPYGCSVWPSWWSHAPQWPTGGEIDTFEGVNNVARSQIGLHTLPGCTQVGQTQTSTIVNSTDCSYQTNSNQGCISTNPNPASYGAAFAQAGGGVFVTEFAESGVSIWFFSRPNVPSVILSNSSSIDTSTFGTPVGNWPSTGCASKDFFDAQNLIFVITLCGDYAGAPGVFSQTCQGVCYNDYVLGNGAIYSTAYFEVAYVRVFSKEGTNTIVTGNSSSSGGTPSLRGISASRLSVLGLAALISLAALFQWV